jgi:ElaB/YqjD/DUF883 family membrane-anchored ribosome-binding protein
MKREPMRTGCYPRILDSRQLQPVETAMSDVSGRLKEASSTAKNKADETVENVRSGMAKAVDHAADTLRSKSAEAAEAGMDAIDQVRDASSSLRDALKTSIERQPFTAISLAVAAGFLFGMMFFRRN